MGCDAIIRHQRHHPRTSTATGLGPGTTRRPQRTQYSIRQVVVMLWLIGVNSLIHLFYFRVNLTSTSNVCSWFDFLCPLLVVLFDGRCRPSWWINSSAQRQSRLLISKEPAAFLYMLQTAICQLIPAVSRLQKSQLWTFLCIFLCLHTGGSCDLKIVFSLFVFVLPLLFFLQIFIKLFVVNLVSKIWNKCLLMY